MTAVAIRRKADGLYLHNAYIHAQTPRYAQSEGKARMVIRIDRGADLDEYELVPREQVKP